MAGPGASGAAASPEDDYPELAELFLHKCFQCHTIGDGERVGPDLIGVTRRRDGAWLRGYIPNADEYIESDPLAIELLQEYEGMRMPHLGPTEEKPDGLTAEDVEGLLGFIDAHDPLKPAPGVKPVAAPAALTPPRTAIPASSASAFIWFPGLVLLAGLMVAMAAMRHLHLTNAFKLSIVPLIAVGYWSFGGHGLHRLPENDQGYQPEQPIAFSHALHSGELAISCLYCHHGAERSPVAGLPALGTCMGCHKVVKKRRDAREPSEDLALLTRAYEDAGQRANENAIEDASVPASSPLAWVRVHNLPEHVKFDHRVHVGNGINCIECHGDVARVERIGQQAPLTMGWCIQCHRQDGEQAPAHWKNRAGATLDCAACHY